MLIEITRAAANLCGGPEKLRPFGLSEHRWQRDDRIALDLSQCRPPALARLRRLLSSAAGRGNASAEQAVADVDRWTEALTVSAGAVKPRDARQFAALATRFLAAVPGHRVYSKDPAGRWVAAYVGRVEYRRADRQRHAACVVTFLYEEFGFRKSDTLVFHGDDVRGRSVEASLAAKNLYPETAALRAAYVAEAAAFRAAAPAVGSQWRLVGRAVDVAASKESWWAKAWVVAGTDADPARVVVDTFGDGDEVEEDDDDDVPRGFWEKPDAEGDELDFLEADEADGEEAREELVPVRPYLVVFDLVRHLRLAAHIGQLTKHDYDRALDEKLVLPADVKAFVRVLVERKAAGFRDVVGGKAGGSVVLLAGPAGCGKTLTAEVYAEADGRPLYSVQCSQLGVNPSSIERQLTLVLARARRWGAVVLLDEADVYVSRRGDSLEKNAVVGAFLRVLEQQDETVFLTTNLPESVDDAIASRCVARIDYAVPTEAEQAEIWRVLAASSGVELAGGSVSAAAAARRVDELELSARALNALIRLRVKTVGQLVDLTPRDFQSLQNVGAKTVKELRDMIGELSAPSAEGAVERIARENPGLSGRDVKQLLKLARAMRGGAPVRPEDVAAARRFRPARSGAV